MKFSEGLPLLSTRKINDEEVSYLGQQVIRAKQVRRRMLVLAWAIPSLFLTLPLIGDLLGNGLIIASVCIMLGGAAAILANRDAKARLRRLEEAGRDMQVEVYGNDDEWFARLVPSGVVIDTHRGHTAQVVTVEAVAASDRQISPADASGLFPSHLVVTADGIRTNRELSADEIDELKRVIGRVATKPRPLTILAFLYIIGNCIAGFMQPASGLSHARLFVSVGLLALFGFQFARHFPQYKALLKDRNTHHVVRLPYDGHEVEILPHSGLVWTVNGEISEVRRHGQQAIVV